MEVGKKSVKNVSIKESKMEFFCGDGMVMYLCCGSGHTNPHI